MDVKLDDGKRHVLSLSIEDDGKECGKAIKQQRRNVVE
jgi:hypothetical protein